MIETMISRSKRLRPKIKISTKRLWGFRIYCLKLNLNLSKRQIVTTSLKFSTQAQDELDNYSFVSLKVVERSFQENVVSKIIYSYMRKSSHSSVSFAKRNSPSKVTKTFTCFHARNARSLASRFDYSKFLTKII